MLETKMNQIEKLLIQVYTELIRGLTGELFTKEQISQITTHTIGKYFKGFFPAIGSEKNALEKVEEAKDHITKANSIIAEMQSDLTTQTNQLNILLKDIEEKKGLAKKYANLSSLNKDKFSAFKEEMSTTLREELVQQSAKGRTLRRISSFIIWLVTILLGAMLGAYFKDILTWMTGKLH